MIKEENKAVIMYEGKGFERYFQSISALKINGLSARFMSHSRLVFRYYQMTLFQLILKI